MKRALSTALVLMTTATSVTVAPGAGSSQSLRPANSNSGDAAVSGDGRFVAFTSEATDLVRGDTNGRRDVFLRDRVAGTTELVSLTDGGAQGDDESASLGISADGRFVLFASAASNLAPGECCWKIYVRDRAARTTTAISPLASALKYVHAAISADGRFVAFTSYGQGEIAGRRRIGGAVFVWDRVSGTTELVTEGGSTALRRPAISADGRFVAFISQAADLVPGDSNSLEDIFVRDRASGTTERVSVGPNAAEANGGSYDVAISGDGRLIAFDSVASNLAPGDANQAVDVFVRNRAAATTTRVNESDGASLGTISADGRFVVFIPRAPNGILGVVVRDIAARTTEVVSVAGDGRPAENSSYTGSGPVSADGRFVGFYSPASNLVPGDLNGADDVFVRDRLAQTTELVSVARARALKADRLVLRPAHPLAGSTLVATMRVTVDGAPVSEGQPKCIAASGGRKIVPSVTDLRVGIARCVWRLPASLRGKRLAGSVSVTTADGTASRAFAVRVG